MSLYSSQYDIETFFLDKEKNTDVNIGTTFHDTVNGSLYMLYLLPVS